MQTSALKFCILIALVPASLSFHSFAQAPAAGAAPAVSYADEPMVIERSDTVVFMAADGTGWRERTLVARLQSDEAVKKYSVLNVPYANNSQHVEIAYARVRHADGTVVETPATEAMDMPAAVTRTAPFYSDLKELQLPLRSLRVGDTLELKYNIVRTKAETPGEFWGRESFGETAVALEQTLELRVPAGIYVQVWSPTMKPAEEDAPGNGTTPGQHIYRWSDAQLKPTVGKEAEAAVAAKKKVLWTADQELDAEQGKLPTVAWTTFKSWEDVGAWYRGLEADRIVADDTVKAKVAELTKGKATDEAKARALYDYVATNIRYIGVAFGIGRYQPHTAAEILSNQYGDCKDKHTLLAAMLAAAGIKSDAVLIGAGVRFNEAVPSPASFNHLITRTMIDGKPVWLDSTAEVAPWAMLVSVTRDKQALVVPTSAAATIVRTPVDPPIPTVVAVESIGSLGTDGVSTSRIVITFRGDSEIPARAGFRLLSPDKYDAMVQLMAKLLGFSGTTSNPEITRPTDMTQPFKLSFNYKREKAGDWEHLRTLPEVIQARFSQVTEMEPPVHAIQLGVPGTQTSTSAMKLPEGWSAILPPAVHTRCAYASYDMVYRLENGTVYADRTIEVMTKKVPVSDWRAYKAFVDVVNPGKERYIQLVSASSGGTLGDVVSSKSANMNWLLIKSTGGTSYTYVPAPVTAGGSPGNAEADKLIRSVYPFSESKDLDVAQKALDQAKALSPEQVGLWSTYGLLAVRRNDYAAAEADLRKELALHPDQTNLYVMLESLEKRLNMRKERMATLYAWLDSGSGAAAPAIELMSTLIDEGDPAAAVKVASADHVSDAMRNNINLQLELGRALLRAGDTKSGATILKGVLERTQDATVRNNVAYYLSEANVEPAVAETASRQANEQWTQVSGGSMLEDNPETLRARRMALASNWDTLGWVLFREGKLDEARSYIAAAWTNVPSDQVGEHLGDVLTAQGDKAGALTVYQLALATIPGASVRDTATSRGYVKSLQERIDALSKAGVKSIVSDAGGELLALRTILLGQAGTESGEVEYRLLLKNGRAVKAESTEAKPIAGVDAGIAKADFSRLFPAGSQAVVVRTAHVNCKAGACELILEP